MYLFQAHETIIGGGREGGDLMCVMFKVSWDGCLMNNVKFYDYVVFLI